MSLATPAPIKTFKVGLIASKGFDDPDFLSELFGGNISAVSHIYTNGANPLVLSFAASVGIPLTIFPLTAGRSLPWSTSMILDNVDFTYIVADPDSKSAAQVVEECVKRKVKHRLIPYTPFTHWRDKVSEVAGILSATTREDVAANETLKALWRIV